MLVSRQIAELAEDFRAEARHRPYLKAIIPTLAEDENFWRLMLELLEIIVHRRGYVIVPRALLEPDDSVRSVRDTVRLRSKSRV